MENYLLHVAEWVTLLVALVCFISMIIFGIYITFKISAATRVYRQSISFARDVLLIISSIKRRK